MPKTLYFGLEIDAGGVRVFFNGSETKDSGYPFFSHREGEDTDIELGYFKTLLDAATIIRAQVEVEGL